ncbi:MAG: hypothetical protein ACRBDL_06780 [Alphaproteobacteria bacterium]
MRYILSMSLGFFLLSIQSAHATSLPGIVSPVCYTFGLAILASVYIRVYRVRCGKDKYLSFRKSFRKNAISFFMVVPVYGLLLVWDNSARKFSILGKNPNYIESIPERTLVLAPYLLALYFVLCIVNLVGQCLRKRRNPEDGHSAVDAIRWSLVPFLIVLASLAVTIFSS